MLVFIAVAGIIIIISVAVLYVMYNLGKNYNLADTIFGNSGLPGTKGYNIKQKEDKKWNEDGSVK